MDLGVIGNCHYSALIDTDANVAFMCWPRFDSDFAFASLLDRRMGGYFRIRPASSEKGEQKYLFNSSVLSTTFKTKGGTFQVIDFAPRFLSNRRFFKPTTLIRIVKVIEGEPSIRVDIQPVFNYARQQMTADISSNHIRFEGGGNVIRLYSNASLNLILEGRPFPANETMYFALTYNSPLDVPLKETCESYFERTLTYWQRWVKHCVLPRSYQREVIRSAMVLKLHQFEDTGAMIAATTTSIPEARDTERNWDYRFCWLRDAQMMVWTLHTLNHFEELEEFIKFLRFLTQEEGQDLQPVYGISGERKLTEEILSHLEGYHGNPPVRVGNAAYKQSQYDVFGGLIVALSPLYLDVRFRNDENPLSTRLVHHLMDGIEKTFSSPDAGIWEYRSEMKVHTYTILQHWKGASKAMEIARTCKDEPLYRRASDIAQRSSLYLSNSCWNESNGIYTQNIDGVFADASLLMLINSGFLDQSNPRALRHVENYVKILGTKNGFIRRYIHTDDFGETENAFIICSFWLVEAYARLGQQVKAQELMERLISSANPLGLYSEDIDPKTGELWGNFPQTYSHVGLIRAAFALSPPWFG